MKATDEFKQTILSYLEVRSIQDELFAASFAKEGKNLDDCIKYILTSVQASGCNGFADDEIFCMAVHYYDEDTIVIGNPVRGSVVVNHVIELTEEEKREVKEKAMKIAVDEQLKSITSKSKLTTRKDMLDNRQPSLF